MMSQPSSSPLSRVLQGEWELDVEYNLSIQEEDSCIFVMYLDVEYTKCALAQYCRDNRMNTYISVSERKTEMSTGMV
jgi:hypothetical protein